MSAAEMSKRRSRPGSAPPRTGGVPNPRGYQEDQPKDAASATCCALLRPPPQSRRALSILRAIGDPKPRRRGRPL